jgi:hypothetical protein
MCTVVKSKILSTGELNRHCLLHGCITAIEHDLELVKKRCHLVVSGLRMENSNMARPMDPTTAVAKD